jgi:hypothetical protein
MCNVDGCNRGTADRRRSRKRRTCRACFERIDLGDEYVRQLAWDSGDTYVTIQCLRCARLYAELLRTSKPGDYVAFALDCGEYINDPEHPLQWLAFALPSDLAVSEALR